MTAFKLVVTEEWQWWEVNTSPTSFLIMTMMRMVVMTMMGMVVMMMMVMITIAASVSQSSLAVKFTAKSGNPPGAGKI